MIFVGDIALPEENVIVSKCFPSHIVEKTGSEI